MPKLSICIPTFNRASQLTNCLQSLITIKEKSNIDFQICVSDNGSTDETEKVVQRAQEKIPIKYNKNPSNLGIPRNFLKVMDMADGEFAWLIGDDDLLLPNTVDDIYDLFKKNPSVDYFFINSFHLTTEYVFSFPQPFDVANLPHTMQPFSTYKEDGELPFFDLVNPKVSFDFLGGMFLAVFRRSMWLDNINTLDEKAISDLRTFSSFDNTFPHVKIFAKAFSKSKAYFYSKPLSVCLTGAREWSPMFPFIQSVRLIEALEEYRKNGMPFWKYVKCRNFGLRNFASDLGAMLVYPNRGFQYVSLHNIIFKNLLYPNTYFSFFTFLFRKIQILIKKLFEFKSIK